MASQSILQLQPSRKTRAGSEAAEAYDYARTIYAAYADDTDKDPFDFDRRYALRDVTSVWRLRK